MKNFIHKMKNKNLSQNGKNLSNNEKIHQYKIDKKSFKKILVMNLIRKYHKTQTEKILSSHLA
jgi:hypothetical protein